jgi:hypothetical protein
LRPGPPGAAQKHDLVRYNANRRVRSLGGGRARCDTIANINYTALDQMSDAAAHTALTLARRAFRRKPLTNPPPLASGSGDQSGGGGLHADHDHDAVAE